MVEPKTQGLSVEKQCQLVGISKSNFYYKGKGESPFNLALMRIIDEQFLKTPFYGSRRMSNYLKREGLDVGRDRVRRLMKLMGLRAIYQAPRTSKRHPDHKIYPYLLRGLKIDRANQVWATDITYIPVQNGFLYLTAVMDWYSRKILSWKLSNTMDTSFCIEALEEAIEKYGKPEIFNTDQGSQFTSHEFTNVLKESEIKISMDGRGRWIDNVFIERIWRSLKYECIYLNAYETGEEVRHGVREWVKLYNFERPHQTFGGHTPHEVYNQITNEYLAA